MSSWVVYSKDGLEKCEVRQLEYSGEFLGACSVSLNISSPTPISFEIGDWLEYRGERFELNYDPSIVKQSSSESTGDAFVYENVTFNSLSDELTRCDFLDVVPYDNGLHYSSLPTFSFFAESIEKLAERIQVNLDRVYKGDKSWTIVVHPEYVNKSNINISASNLTCWDALALVKSQFDANFTIKGRVITIGTSGLAVGNLFTYGKGNGLYKIERNAESNQKIITRLRAYGSTRNMPSGYYRNIEGGNVPNNMAVTHLMLPSFPTQTTDPYLDSDNIEELGVREGTVFFDGSGDLEEIYPTMEGVTAEDLKQAGIPVSATGPLDVIKKSEQIDDNGKFEEGDTISDFTITLKDIGFDINDHLSSTTATISMKDGMCGGREFEIVKCEKGNNEYILTCHRSYDEGLDLYFPYNDYQIRSGDKFVLLNIEMPDVYIKVASQRLLDAAKDYLSKNDYVRYSYTPSVDNIYMARQHIEAVANGLPSIHDTIKEGDLILFNDDDLGVSGSIIIDSLSIKEDADESVIPEYEITLKNEKAVGTLEKIQNQISSKLNGGSSLNTEQVSSIIDAVGSKIFIRKDKNDTVKGVLSFDKQIKSSDFVQGDLFGTGWSIYKDSNGNTVVETDRIVARKSLEATELVVNQETFEKGSNIFVKGGCTITKVEIANGRYRCYYNNEEGRRFSGFKVGDQARCQRYNASYGGIIKYYWRLVTGVEEDYIELSMTDCDGTGIPEEGDDIAQLGSRYDKTRQSAIVISPDNGGSVIIWAGIDSFDLSEKNMVGMGVNPNTGRAYLYGYGDMFFGDRSLEKNYITYQTREGDTEPTLNINADIHFGKGSDGLSNLSEFKDIQNEVDNLFSQIEREFTIWYYDYEPTLDNEPAVNWVTDADKALHDQDIFFSDKLARAWRFVNGAWIEITDERTLSVLKLAEEAQVAAEEAQDTADQKRRVFVKTPYTPYDEGDLWVQGETGDIMRCSKSRSSGNFVSSDWVKASKYTDNSALEEFIQGDYKNQLASIQSQMDKRAETWYQVEDPALAWTTQELKRLHAGDLWYNINEGLSYMWSGTEWVIQGVPDEMFDTIDGKASIYTSQPSSYKKNDLWVLTSDTVLDKSYKSGTIVVAKQDSNTFVASHWTKLDRYTDDSKAEESMKKISDIEYIKDAFGKDNRVMDGGVLVSKLVSVQNSNENIESFINGSDYAKDSVHGKLIIAGGIPDKTSNGLYGLQERSKEATIRVYEDGSAFFGNANISGSFNSGNGKTSFDKDGSGQLANGNIKWDSDGTMWKKSPEYIVWRRIEEEYEAGDTIDLQGGSYLDITAGIDYPEYTLPLPETDKTIAVRYILASRSDAPAMLGGSFNINGIETTRITIAGSGRSFDLEYNTTTGKWHYYGYSGVGYFEKYGDVVVLLDKEEESTTPSINGLTKTITIHGVYGEYELTFESGLLTGYKYNPTEGGN